MKILILGGTGYIGGALYQFLNNRPDYQVDTVDLEWFGNYTNPNNINLDFAYLTPEFYNKYQAIILLAGHSSVQMSEGNNVSCFNNNVRNFVNLLPKLNKDTIFIYASSSSVYGNVRVNQATERCDIFIPENSYDLSKSEIDNHAKLCGLHFYGLRFGTVNGQAPNFRSDIMINSMATNGLRQKEIFVSSPEISRPILGILDLCSAVTRIIETNDRKLRGIYNLASFNATVKDIGEKVSQILDVKLTVGEGRSNYDFTINSNKFSTNFNFEFCDNIETIVEGIMLYFHEIHVGKRDVPISYL